MGHVRLGTLPDTAPWRRVVGLVAGGADAASVAEATTRAAVRGLNLARCDEGLAHGLWLLARVAAAGRAPDFAEALREAGVGVEGEPRVAAIAAGLSDALDRHLARAGGRTDVSEMAQFAAVESAAALLRQRAADLYEVTPEHVRRAAAELAGKQGFAVLAHDFFSRFTRRFLAYHLGRELSNHVGGCGRFAGPKDHDAFLSQLDVHCREAAGIMRGFAGGWFAKHSALGPITAEAARAFVAHAVRKLKRELLARGARDGQ